MSEYQLTISNTTDFLIPNNTSKQTMVKSKRKREIIYEKCNECKKRKSFRAGHNICRVCYRSNQIFKPTGNKIIDDFIKYTQCNIIDNNGKMESVPYSQFKDIEFIAEGGFSKVYRATWIDGPNFNKKKWIVANKQVVLKKLNNSKNITFKELNEV